ncbi:MAG: efflux family protein [Clostridiales bacterium]|jgi:putative MATE family efflux protein|nr:efflux family protein [Clostridiales bacterium]
MEQFKENKMGVMPVNKLLVTMSLPMVISMLVQALYNIVDSIFVAQISDNALTAVSLSFPIQQLMIAVGVGTGVGINAIVSRKLGEKHFEEANLAATNGIFLAIISWIAFATFGILGAGAFIRAFSTNAEVIKMGTEYISICTIFSLGIFLQITCERLMQSTGNTIYNMFIQGTGAILNIILDPILIFGLFGFPKLGVAGAAIATVIGQTSGMALGIFLNLTKNKEIKLKIKGFIPNKQMIIQIYKIGIPSIIMQSIGAVLIFGLNKILITFSEVGVSVLGVYFKLQSFIFMPVFGITNGLIPIIAYNYGARKKKRIIDSIKLAIVLATSIMLLGVTLFWVIPDKLLLLFNASDEMLSIGVPALRTISISFVFAGTAIVISSVFQALGNGMHSLVMSVIRQLLVILPVAYLLSKFVSRDALWLAFPIAEVVSAVACFYLFRHIYLTKIKPLGDVK